MARLLDEALLLVDDLPSRSSRKVATLDDGDSADTLDMSSQRLGLVPSEVFRFTHLRSLDLSRNSIQILPADVGALMCLETLELSRNLLRTLPENMRHLKRLTTLLLLSNQINHRLLPMQVLLSLPKLRVLDLCYNKKCKGEVAAATLAPLMCRGAEVRLIMSPGEDATPESRGMVGAHACDRDATLLRSQLEPWGTPTLVIRLEDVFGVKTAPTPWGNPGGRRESVMRDLLACHKRLGPRAIRRATDGAKISTSAYEALLAGLHDWSENWNLKERDPLERERQTVRAENYMILRSPAEFGSKKSKEAIHAAAKLKQHEKLWKLAELALLEVDVEFANEYTAIAFTDGFTGSPHIDTQNIAPFYGLALGEFTGGELCVESGPCEVTMIDTSGRLVKVDGRYPHWVAPFEGRRFSVIYYVTIGAFVPRGPAVFMATVPDSPTPDDSAAQRTMRDNIGSSHTDRVEGAQGSDMLRADELQSSILLRSGL